MRTWFQSFWRKPEEPKKSILAKISEEIFFGISAYLIHDLPGFWDSQGKHILWPYLLSRFLGTKRFLTSYEKELRELPDSKKVQYDRDSSELSWFFREIFSGNIRADPYDIIFEIISKGWGKTHGLFLEHYLRFVPMKLTDTQVKAFVGQASNYHIFKVLIEFFQGRNNFYIPSITLLKALEAKDKELSLYLCSIEDPTYWSAHIRPVLVALIHENNLESLVFFREELQREDLQWSIYAYEAWRARSRKIFDYIFSMYSLDYRPYRHSEIVRLATQSFYSLSPFWALPSQKHEPVFQIISQNDEGAFNEFLRTFEPTQELTDEIFYLLIRGKIIKGTTKALLIVDRMLGTFKQYISTSKLKYKASQEVIELATISGDRFVPSFEEYL